MSEPCPISGDQGKLGIPNLDLCFNDCNEALISTLLQQITKRRSLTAQITLPEQHTEMRKHIDEIAVGLKNKLEGKKQMYKFDTYNYQDITTLIC